MRRRYASGGYAILAALVFVAVLSGLTAIIRLVDMPGNPMAMSAAINPSISATQAQQTGSGSTASPSTTATPEGAKTDDKPKLEGPARCNAPLEAKRGQQKEVEGVSTICVKGCTYRVHGGTGKETKVEAIDRCSTLSAGPAAQCRSDQSTEACRVEICNESGCTTMSSGKPEEFLGRAAGVPDYFRNDKEILDALNKAKNGEDPYAQLNQLPSWYQDAFEEVKQDELAKIDSAKIDTLKEIDRLSAGVESGTNFGSELERERAKLSDLEQQQKNLSNVSALSTDISSINNRPSSPWDEAGFTQPLTEPTSCKTASCVDGEIARNTNTFEPHKSPADDTSTSPPGGGIPGGGIPGGGTPGGGSGGGGGNPLSALAPFLKSLLGPLLSSLQDRPACASDPNAYRQQQQEYQMQMQRYNYLLQQHQYDERRAQMYGLTPPPAPTPPVACEPTGATNTCPAEPPRPVSGCANGDWRPISSQQSTGRQCTTSWQCVPSNATPPTAEMSCQPKVVDVGMSVAISFACTNATGSKGEGDGFNTNDQTSGSRSVEIAEPPANAKGINFRLTCRNQNLTAHAECAVQIARPTIVLIANPLTVEENEASSVGWVTSGMQSCVVSSPQMPSFTTRNASSTAINGVATTSSITEKTDVVLTCETIGGTQKRATTTITLIGATTTAMRTRSH